MSSILSQLAASLPTAPQLPPATVQIKLSTPLPVPITSAPSAPEVATSNTPVTLTVISSQPNGQSLLQLPDGTRLTAQVLPSPTPGSQILLPPATAQTLSVPTSTNLQLPIVNARLLPPTPPSASPLPQSSAPAAALPASPSPVLSLPDNLPPQISNPAAALSQQLLSAIKIASDNKPISSSQNIIPQGPLNISFKQQDFQKILQTPFTLTLTTPTTGQLSLPGQPAQFVTLTTPSTLPLRTTLSLPALPNPNLPQQPLLLLTQPVTLPASSTYQTPSLPPTPPLLSALKVLLPTNQPAPVPVNIPLTARVLSQPLPQQPYQGQALLLASGHTAVLQSPQPIPAESTLVVEFPTLTGPAQVVRVQPAGQQSTSAQPQGNPATTPTAPQTSQPVLPVGTVVQGTLSGQTEQGQPLLTISQPAQFSGQTIPLTLPENLQAQVPLGSQLSVRIAPQGTPATLVSLTLPPNVQRALTLTTLGVQWPALQQAVNLLASLAPAVAQNLKDSLPQLANLLPGLMMVTEALRKNSPEMLFGKETTTLLRAMGVNLAPDVQQLSQLQQPQPDNAWRGTLFPYLENPQADPRQGGFFWRREKKDDPRASTSTRFILQLSLTQMGEVQLDGLINYPEIWLKLRRTTPAEGGFTEGLQTLVNATLASHGLSGGIAVEISPSFPVNPLAEMLQATPNPLPTSA